MAGSACYNIVYMSERFSASETYRVTGGGRKKQEKTIAPVIKKRRVIPLLLIQTKVSNSLCFIYSCFCSVVIYYVLWDCTALHHRNHVRWGKRDNPTGCKQTNSSGRTLTSRFETLIREINIDSDRLL